MLLIVLNLLLLQLAYSSTGSSLHFGASTSQANSLIMALQTPSPTLYVSNLEAKTKKPGTSTSWKTTPVAQADEVCRIAGSAICSLQPIWSYVSDMDDDHRRFEQSLLNQSRHRREEEWRNERSGVCRVRRADGSNGGNERSDGKDVLRKAPGESHSGIPLYRPKSHQLTE